MSEENLDYEIKDDLPVVDNLATFADALMERDADLAAILTPILGKMSSGQVVARDELLDAMLAATKPNEEKGK